MEKDYVDILYVSLKKKSAVLEELAVLTEQQEDLIRRDQADSEEFSVIYSKKDVLIDQLNREDAGFETIYERVREELGRNREAHKEKILSIQKLITGITDKSVKLKAMEQRNKMAMEQYFSRKRKEIRDFKANNQAVSQYYKSMAGKHQEGTTYFLDHKN